MENYIFNLFNIRFSFRERSGSQEEKKIFKMKKQDNCDLYCLSDAGGFSLLSLNNRGELKVFYYDFEKKFSIKIKTRIPIYSWDIMPGKYTRDTKLCSRSIWILTYMLDWISSIDVISIKDEKVLYHVRNHGGHCYFNLFNVFSGVMLLVQNCRERFKFYDWKALCIDHDELIPFKLSEKKLIEFYKPKELENEDLDVLGTVKTTIILIPKTYSNRLYFLIYDKKMQFQAFKKIDISCFCENARRIPLKLGGFIPEILKLLVPISTKLIATIDVEKVKVTQILDTQCKFEFFTPPKYIKWSKDDKMLNLFYNLYFCNDDYMTLLKYVLYKGQSLKELALNTVVSFVTMEQIHASNLSQSLLREIMARKIN